MKKSPQEVTFQSRLVSISDEMEYYALAVPAEITRALGTHAAVAVLARVNDSKPFRGSFYPVGGGKHFMRIKAEVRKETGIEEGDRVRVRAKVVDRADITLPKDVASALRAAGALAAFNAQPPGKRNYTLRYIDQAAKPETRIKRIQSAIKEALEN
jgi:hypothetical protein